MKTILESILICIFITTKIHSEITVYSRLGAGYFSELMNVVRTIKIHEHLYTKGITIDWSQEFFPYKDHPTENGWDLYFEPIVFHTDAKARHLASRPHPDHAVHDQLCIDHWMAYDEHLSYRQDFNRILDSYIIIKREIIDELKRLYNEHLEGYYCIGVHVRWSAAHTSESPKGTPPIESYIAEVSDLIQNTETTRPFKIYLATDSEEVIQAFRNHFSEELLVYLSGSRSPHREESHLIYDNAAYWQAHPSEFHAKKPGYRGGVMVLLDCLLLAKCDLFIHSSSNVSEFVSFFSPTIKSIYLPKDSRTWPCRYGL